MIRRTIFKPHSGTNTFEERWLVKIDSDEMSIFRYCRLIGFIQKLTTWELNKPKIENKQQIALKSPFNILSNTKDLVITSYDFCTESSPRTRRHYKMRQNQSKKMQCTGVTHGDVNRKLHIPCK